MMIKLQNMKAGPHGFGDDRRLQFKGGEVKEIDSEWLKPFDNEPNAQLFKGPNPHFRVVQPNEDPAVSAGLMAALGMPVVVAKPKQDLVAHMSDGPKSASDILAAINAGQTGA